MPTTKLMDPDLVERLRERCIQAALDGYEDAGLSGLCGEGRWEAAISAIRRADLEDLASSQRVDKFAR